MHESWMYHTHISLISGSITQVTQSSISLLTKGSNLKFLVFYIYNFISVNKIWGW